MRPIALLVVVLSAAALLRAEEWLRVEAKGGEVRVAAPVDGDTAVIDVTSPEGIGRMTVERTAMRWPARVVLQMRLKGLESLYVVSGGAELGMSVSSSPPHTPHAELKLAADAASKPIDRDSPYFPEVRVGDGDGDGDKPSLEKGGFRITLPPKLFEANPRTISIRWIDFLRG